MLEPKEISRYTRQISLAEIGLQGQIKLKQAKVLVVGAGGLGCPVLQYLSAAGIGTLAIVDGDIVSQSNLARQILFNQNDIGKNKAQTAQEKISLLNPYTQLIVFPQYLNVSLALTIFRDFDLVLDCTDNFAARYLINDVCVLYKIPFISAAISQQEGQLAFFNMPINEGNYSANYRDVYPEFPNGKVHLNCEEAGVLSTLPGIMALYQSNEALKYFLNKKQCLVNTLFFINPWNMEHFQINIESSSHIKLTREEIEKYQYEYSCTSKTKVRNISLEESEKYKNALWIDVREKHENPFFIEGKCYSFPLSELEGKLNELQDKDTLFFFCESGKRSAEAAALVKEKYPEKEIHNLLASAQQIKNTIYATTYSL